MPKPNGSFHDEFEDFWRNFPRKVGKFAAQKEYDKVRRNGTTQGELLNGIARYVKTKPDYADYCHARTWLSQGRWLDQVDEAPLTPQELADARASLARRFGRCSHDPPCPDRFACVNAIAYAIRAQSNGHR